MASCMLAGRCFSSSLGISSGPGVLLLLRCDSTLCKTDLSLMWSSMQISGMPCLPTSVSISKRLVFHWSKMILGKGSQHSLGAVWDSDTKELHTDPEKVKESVQKFYQRVADPATSAGKTGAFLPEEAPRQYPCVFFWFLM